MPADRVSVGSPGGAGGNETEAVARAIHRKDMSSGRARYDWDEMQQGYRDDCLRHARAALDAVRRSPQGEDHEAACPSCWVLPGEPHHPGCTTPPPVSGEDHEAPPPGKFVSIAANKAMAAPVSDTEPCPVRNGVCLLCGSGVLASGEHVRDDLPPCYGKAPVSGTEPDTAKLRAEVLTWVYEYALDDATPDVARMYEAFKARFDLAWFSVDAGKAEEER